MKSELKTPLMLVIVIVTGIGVMSVAFSAFDQQVAGPDAGLSGGDVDAAGNAVLEIDKSRFKTAPEIVGIADYINTTPEALAQSMEDKVILYDIWTYSCINCIRTLPHITAWDDKYADQGLLIVGIHSPEFEFEKDVNNVQAAVSKHGISYPVVLDNDKETWKAFENRYWPRKYIADHEGFIRYDHIGEGAYQETERVIQQLLKERSAAFGVQTASATGLVDVEEFEHSQFRTPELYFGYHFAQNRNQLGSQEGFSPGRTVTYAEPDAVNLHKFYPVGEWTNYPDSMELESDSGVIKLRYNAKEVNIVTEDAAELEIFLDGRPIPQELAGMDVTSGNMVIVDDPDLYNIVTGDSSEEHLLEIRVSGQGFQIFTFTFG